MKAKHRKQLAQELEHLEESGLNLIRLTDTVEEFINKRYIAKGDLLTNDDEYYLRRQIKKYWDTHLMDINNLEEFIVTQAARITSKHQKEIKADREELERERERIRQAKKTVKGWIAADVLEDMLLALQEKTKATEEVIHKLQEEIQDIHKKQRTAEISYNLHRDMSDKLRAILKSAKDEQ